MRRFPRTYRYYLHHYAARLFRLSGWLNFASGRHPFRGRVRQSLTASLGAVLGEPPGYQPRPDLQRSDTRTFLEQAYLQATAAGVRILSVFTADLQAQHNYREQLVDAFPAVQFGDRLQLEYFSDADHSFSLPRDERVSALSSASNAPARQYVAARVRASDRWRRPQRWRGGT